MNKTIYVVVNEFEDAVNYHIVENLQHRAFTYKMDADNWAAKLSKDLGDTFKVVPLELE